MEKAIIVFAKDFIEDFEAVFDIDWSHTELCLSGHYENCLIKEDGTFINPGVKDLGHKWAARASLLSRYKTLKGLLEKYYSDLEIKENLETKGEK